MPVFHVENTLAILQNLLGKYDGTMDALNQVFYVLILGSMDSRSTKRLEKQ